MPERKWQVAFMGDPDYGYDRWEEAIRYPSHGLMIEAHDASTAASRGIAEMRGQDPDGVREEGFYGEGTVVGVQEIVKPPPVKTFIRRAGRMKLTERTLP